MAATIFRTTIGTTAVQASGISGLSGVRAGGGVRLSLDPDNAGKVYYGTAADLTTSARCYLIPAGGETTVNPAEYGGDLDNLYLISDTAAQVVHGAVLS